MATGAGRCLMLSGLAGLLLSGCAGVISSDLRREAAPLTNFAELRSRPDAYRGQTVIVGGEVIETRNRPEGTTLVVLEKPLDRSERPRLDDGSGGRFLVRFADFLDPALFAPGRLVTVAGQVTGTEEEAVGEVPYAYVVLDGREVHLWRDRDWDPYRPWSYHDPWYPWWYDPYWGRRPWWW